jgi:hypothetical protein
MNTRPEPSAGPVGSSTAPTCESVRPNFSVDSQDCKRLQKRANRNAQSTVARPAVLDGSVGLPVLVALDDRLRQIAGCVWRVCLRKNG